MRKISMGLGAVLLVLGILGPVHADLINFESGFTDQQIVTSVVTPTNSVTFGVGPDKTPAYIAMVGPPRTAFVWNDTPADTKVSGNFFLTDEVAPWYGPTSKSNYYMSFATPVRNLSLNLYDYRGFFDGGPSFGDRATLTVFDQNGNPVGTDIYTVPLLTPNGSIAWLSVMAPSAPIKEAWLVFSTGDVGTGIDNITFTTVPLPPSLLLMGFGLLGLAGLRWRRKKAS